MAPSTYVMQVDVEQGPGLKALLAEIALARFVACFAGAFLGTAAALALFL